MCLNCISTEKQHFTVMAAPKRIFRVGHNLFALAKQTIVSMSKNCVITPSEQHV